MKVTVGAVWDAGVLTKPVVLHSWDSNTYACLYAHARMCTHARMALVSYLHAGPKYLDNFGLPVFAF